LGNSYNKHLKKDCQRVAFPVPLNRDSYIYSRWV